MRELATDAVSPEARFRLNLKNTVKMRKREMRAGEMPITRAKDEFLLNDRDLECLSERRFANSHSK